MTCSASSGELFERSSSAWSSRLGRRVVRAHHRADALAGEELEQQRVRDAAVEDVRPRDAAAQRLDARLDLRDHPLADLASLEQLLEAGDVGLGDQRVASSPKSA